MVDGVAIAHANECTDGDCDAFCLGFFGWIRRTRAARMDIFYATIISGATEVCHH